MPRDHREEFSMRSRVIIWVMFYACTLVAAGGAIWFVGDLNANKWITPSFAPPAWLFGPVWTTLYLLIASSAYRLSYRKNCDSKSIALGLWALQMCLNTLWTPVFFGAFKSSTNNFITSAASDLFVPITPDGPRFAQPTT